MTFFEIVPPEVGFFLLVGILFGVVLGKALSKPKRNIVCPLPDEVILNLVTKKFHKALTETTFDAYKDIVLKLYDDYTQYRSVAKELNDQK